MIKRVRQWFAKRKGTGDGIQIKRRPRLVKQLESYAEAAALAQAGLQDVARDIIRREIQERPKILVVGSRDGFSPLLVESAIGLAKRMACEIVALNCVFTGTEARKGSSAYREELSRGSHSRASTEVQLFASRAAEEGVPFRHLVRQGTPGRCVRELENEVSRLSFVLTESDSVQQGRLEASIPVFSVNK
jgi:hypothetical protein